MTKNFTFNEERHADFEVQSIILVNESKRKQPYILTGRIRTASNSVEVDGFTFIGSDEKVQELLTVLKEVQAKQLLLRITFKSFINYVKINQPKLSFPNGMYSERPLFADKFEVETIKISVLEEAETLWKGNERVKELVNKPEESNLVKELKQTFNQNQELSKEVNSLRKQVSDLDESNWDLSTRNCSVNAKEQKKLTQQLQESKQVSNLTHQKLTSLENQLINLAKQKIKGKKEAQELLTQLETNYKSKENDYQHQLTTKEKELTNLELVRQQEQQELEEELNQTQTKLKELNNQKDSLEAEKKELATSLQLHHQKINALESQLVSLSTQKITTQQTLTRTHQELTQTQTHYQTRKTQALVIGIISLVLILYLVWPLLKKEELKVAPSTWI